MTFRAVSGALDVVAPPQKADDLRNNAFRPKKGADEIV
jgi:hypothetical protein